MPQVNTHRTISAMAHSATNVVRPDRTGYAAWAVVNYPPSPRLTADIHKVEVYR